LAKFKTAKEAMRYMAQFYDHQCFVTQEKFKDRGFVIHHLWYLDNDIRRENFPKGEKGRLQYLNKLVPMVEAMPFRFALIKNGIHTRIDHPKRGLSRLKRENLYRLFLLTIMTKKERKKTQ
jgi:hypothetical protein